MHIEYVCDLDMSVDLDRLGAILACHGIEGRDYSYHDESWLITVTPKMLATLDRVCPGWVETTYRRVWPAYECAA